jgi:hypothetical protein
MHLFYKNLGRTQSDIKHGHGYEIVDQRFQLRIPTAAILTFRDWWSRRSSGFILGYERLEQLELLTRLEPATL